MFKNANGSWSKSKLMKASYNDLIKVANGTGCAFSKPYFVNLIVKTQHVATGGSPKVGEYSFDASFNGVSPMTFSYVDYKGVRIFTDKSTPKTTYKTGHQHF